MKLSIESFPVKCSLQCQLRFSIQLVQTLKSLQYYETTVFFYKYFAKSPQRGKITIATEMLVTFSLLLGIIISDMRSMWLVHVPLLSKSSRS